jgi:hypothetical protein
MTTVENFNTISRYLARRDIEELTSRTVPDQVDLLVFMPSGLIEPIHVAATAMKSNIARKLVISGGIGHSTQALRDAISHHSIYGSVVTAERAEADIIRDVMVDHLGVDPATVIVENESTNCGTNAEKSYDIVQALGVAGRSLILVQDPTMQQRSQACFERAWKSMSQVSIKSFAPFIPIVRQGEQGLEVGGSSEDIWPFERFAALALGEIPRLRDDENGYGPKGYDFIDHVEIPPDVLQAHAELMSQFDNLDRKAQN